MSDDDTPIHDDLVAHALLDGLATQCDEPSCEVPGTRIVSIINRIPGRENQRGVVCDFHAASIAALYARPSYRHAYVEVLDL